MIPVEVEFHRGVALLAGQRGEGSDSCGGRAPLWCLSDGVWGVDLHSDGQLWEWYVPGLEMSLGRSSSSVLRDGRHACCCREMMRKAIRTKESTL